MSAARLRALLALAEARKTRDLAALEALAAEDRRLAQELAGLAQVHARDLAGPDAPLPVLEARLRWAQAQAAAVQGERTALAGRIALARAQATTALGKREALGALAARAEAEARARAEARIEAERPPGPRGEIGAGQERRGTGSAWDPRRASPVRAAPDCARPDLDREGGGLCQAERNGLRPRRRSHGGIGVTQIIDSLAEIAPGYRVLFCDLWGCLHNGKQAYPEAVEALRRFRAEGGAVVLLTNSPRPAANVADQIAALGATQDCYDLVVSSGDAAQAAMAAGLFGRRLHHIGPERDLPFFEHVDGRPYDVELVPLEEAEGIVCTGLVDDRTQTPADYRETILYGVTKGLRLLCANPDVIVDIGHTRIYCAGAIAEAYAAAGGESFYFGKPHAPIYALARARLAERLGVAIPDEDILCVGDGIATDILGAMGEDLDSIFVTGGLAAEETGTTPERGPDPDRLAAFLDAARLAPRYAMSFLR